ncbi:ABC transporter ATP-binding protein [uncultured Marinobacter sp.]|uniref:ABC transporter ATP-binding protein n=1 Tax=uncultured Marinobacter sp. TaxID=187379 RepID=UPI002607E1C4|nr:ABC transporter ATP-binding protein [uncultured Marinobacter sp.]
MLKVKGLCSGYGNIPVLRDVDLNISEGEVVLIGGENGAGKTTLLQTIAGFVEPTSGSVVFNGVDIAGEAPDKISRLGLRLILDGHRVFPNISVYDNLRLGAAAHKKSSEDFNASVKEVFDMFPILSDKQKDFARDLSGGQQQMLALGQAFVAKPKLLLCDEPSLGLAQALLPPILDFLKQWSTKGPAIVIVEQHIHIAEPYADRYLIMERGELKNNK